MSEHVSTARALPDPPRATSVSPDLRLQPSAIQDGRHAQCHVYKGICILFCLRPGRRRKDEIVVDEEVEVV